MNEVDVKILTEDPNERLDQLDVFIQNYNEKRYYGQTT